MSRGYQPNGSNYHDHLCTCPGCVPDDDGEIEIEEDEKLLSFAVGECPNCGHDWTAHGLYIAHGEKLCETAEMQAIIVITMLDPIEHTSEHPFCSDWNCPCHEDVELVNALNEQVEAGLLTTVEANLIMRGAGVS